MLARARARARARVCVPVCLVKLAALFGDKIRACGESGVGQQLFPSCVVKLAAESARARDVVWAVAARCTAWNWRHARSLFSKKTAWN